MKTGTLLLIGAGAIGLYYFANLGVATNTMQIQIKGIRILSFSDFEITVTVQNVANVGVTVNSMAGNVFINGQQLASISDFEAITVPGNAQTDIVVHASPSFATIPGVIANMANNSSGGIFDFTVIGNVNVNGLVLPFSAEKQISF